MIIHFEITTVLIAVQSSRCLLSVSVLISLQIDNSLQTSPSLKGQDYSSTSNLVSLILASLLTRNISTTLEMIDIS